MATAHYLLCEAPICQDDPNTNYKNEVIWRPSEKICKKWPYQPFQHKQIDINQCVKKGKFKFLDSAYTAHDLETRLI